MSDYIEEGAVKVIEIIGVSKSSFEDAVQQAVTKASQSIKGISGVEVTGQSAGVKDGKVVQFRATLKIAFAVR